MSGRFWALRDPPKFPDSDLARRSPNMVTGKRFICPLDPEHNYGVASPTLSLIVRRQPADFLWSWSRDLACSAPVRQAIEKAGLTGLRFDPAEIERRPKSAEQPGQYFHVNAIGWGGLPAPEAGMTLLSHCRGCRTRSYFIADTTKIVGSGALDGSDFFFVWPARPIFCNERAAEWLHTTGFTGIGLVEANSIDYGGHKFRPAPLSDMIGEKRARQLGGPLGIDD